MADLAHALWPLGDLDRAASLMKGVEERIAGVTHAVAVAAGRLHMAIFELRRGDRVRTAPHALELARITLEHDLPLFRAFGLFLEGLVTFDSGALDTGLEGMRRGAGLLRERNILVFDGLIKIALAEAELLAGDSDRAIPIINEALDTCDRTGYRAFEAELHRVRGDILLNRDPAKPAPAERAFQTAIAVAKVQSARSPVLLASLVLAKLFQSTGRPAQARAVLAPALEGFAPTPEMPQIIEAQTLLAALSEIGEANGSI
jgi:predicted ATPase